MLLPGTSRTPPVMTRPGSPHACASTAVIMLENRMLNIIRLEGFLPRVEDVHDAMDAHQLKQSADVPGRSEHLQIASVRPQMLQTTENGPQPDAVQLRHLGHVEEDLRILVHDR